MYTQTQELYHSGIKGMKWGVRRYYDPEKGTLTDEGRARYYKTNAQSKNELGLKISSKRSDKLTYEKIRQKELGQEQRIATNAAGGINAINSVIKAKKGKTTYGDSTGMSDAELRQRINRIMMERQYSDLTGQTKYKKSGSEVVKDILSVAGGVLTAAGSAAGIALAIHQIKNNA